jgi:hypothetical protein
MPDTSLDKLAIDLVIDSGGQAYNESYYLLLKAIVYALLAIAGAIREKAM